MQVEQVQRTLEIPGDKEHLLYQSLAPGQVVHMIMTRYESKVEAPQVRVR